MEGKAQKSGIEMTEDSVCEICGNGDSLIDDPIVFCDGKGCNVVVHQTCYGICKLPDKDWLCATCQHGLPANSVPCALCPLKGGALKPVATLGPDGICKPTGEWCHAVCGAWIPETHFDSTSAELVLGVAGVAPDRRALKCAVCATKNTGACVQCYIATCAVAFHASCMMQPNSGVLIAVLPSKSSAHPEPQLSPVCPKHVELVKTRYLAASGEAEGQTQPAALPSVSTRSAAPSSSPPAAPRRQQASKKATAETSVKKKSKSKPAAKKSRVADSDESLLEEACVSDEEPAAAPVDAPDMSAKLWPRIENVYFVTPTSEAWKLMEEADMPPPSPPVITTACVPEVVQPSFLAAAAAPAFTPGQSETAPAPSAPVQSEVEIALAAAKQKLRVCVARINPIKRHVLQAYKDSHRRSDKWELAVQATWSQYEVWKSVTYSLQRGMKDQSADFNKRKNEVVPASWLIPTDGRASEDAPPADYEDEDAICQVCFDGESTESNPIVFCDRCNIAIHKRCYGIGVIPEGDYFCDRCRYLKFSNTDVVCCLCPVPDGAFKRTTDSRWVHLVCSLWHSKSVITNVAEMGPVDVSRVLGDNQQQLGRAPSAASYAEFRALLTDATVAAPYCTDPSDESSHQIVELAAKPEPITVATHPVSVPGCANEMCQECRGTAGRTVCCARPGCAVRFHPLCAWYAGYYMAAAVTPGCDLVYTVDPAKRGVSFALYCQHHLPPEVMNQGRSTVAQRQIRLKYRGTEEDDKSRRRKNKRKDPGLQQFSLRMRVRALPSDHYVDGVCGVCFDTRAAFSEEALVCNICSVTVHRVCYGIPASLDKNAFTCQRCQYYEQFANSRSRGGDVPELPNISCALCPCPGGMFKKTVKGQWVHLYCALNIEEVFFHDVMDGIDLSKVPAQRRALRCALCGQRSAGACMQCAGDCYKPFHPMCARNKNWFLTFYDPGDGLCKGVGYCPSHTPAEMRFNTVTQVWERIDIQARLPPNFKRMISLRKELENARLLCERVLRREKFKRNLLYSEANVFDLQRELGQDPLIVLPRLERAAQMLESQKKTEDAENAPVVIRLSKFAIPNHQSLRMYRRVGRNTSAAVAPPEPVAATSSAVVAVAVEEKAGTVEPTGPPVLKRPFFPAFPETTAPSEFDLAGCTADIHSAASFRALLADRAQYPGIAQPAYNLRPRTTTIARAKPTWFSERDTLPAGVRARPVLSSAPERVTLDMQLLKLYEVIAGGPDGTDDLSFLYDLPEDGEEDSYYSVIHHPMSISIIHDRVKQQAYPSMEAFLGDVKLILANLEMLKVDSEDVASEWEKLEERYKAAKSLAKAMTPRGSKKGSRAASSLPSPVAASLPSPVAAGGAMLKCAHCSAGIPLRINSKKPSDAKKCTRPVYCKACLANPSAMLGQRVWLHWPADSKWYSGRLYDWESTEGLFRLLYDDGDWEFMSPAETTVLFGDRDPSDSPGSSYTPVVSPKPSPAVVADSDDDAPMIMPPRKRGRPPKTKSTSEK